MNMAAPHRVAQRKARPKKRSHRHDSDASRAGRVQQRAILGCDRKAQADGQIEVGPIVAAQAVCQRQT